MFSTLSKREIIILAKFDFTSANTFDFVQSKILPFGRELKSAYTTQVTFSALTFYQQIQYTTLKAFADDKFNEAQMGKVGYKKVENNPTKGENGDYQHFLPFS